MCRCATSADGRSTMAETRSITGVDVTVANFAELPDDCYEAIWFAIDGAHERAGFKGSSPRTWEWGDLATRLGL
jgi:hypothetical protein